MDECGFACFENSQFSKKLMKVIYLLYGRLSLDK